ncbi:DNA methylase [Capnocytophaga sputigena]|uniref:DNA methylase n=1 Tax=Capnocytophaga sputigena TaxID=1019 RepID=UPI0028F148C0|nr:DNA methylase [Capnocytophaga sputigena]
MSLDIIHKYDGTPETDYTIKVEKVSFDLKTEKEQNIFQTRSRTELDEELMRSLIPDIDYLNAGLDDYDLNLYAVDYSSFEVPDLSQAIEDTYAPIKQEKDIDREISNEEKKQQVKEAKEAIKQQAIEKAQNLDAYVTLSFDNWKNKESFMLRMGFDPEFKMIKGETLSAKVERID